MSMINWGQDNNRMGNMLDRLFDSSPRARMLAERFDTGLNPAVEVTETDKQFNVHVELPGMKKEDINVDINGNSLTFSGEHKASSEHTDQNVRYSERHYGRFSRTVPVPENVDKDHIKATFTDGILDLEMPKSSHSSSKSKKITVN